MCVCVCVCERSLVEWVPVAELDGKWSPAGSAGGASPPSKGLQLPECHLPLPVGRNGEEEAKGASERERGRDESREQAAAKGAEPSSPGDTGRGAEEEGIAVRTERIPEREPAVAAASQAKS